MKSFRKETPFERRLRELQDQSESLQSEIGTLSRTLRKYEKASPATAVAVAPEPPRTSRLNPNYAATVGAVTATSVAVTNQEPEIAPDEAEPNLFTITPASAPDQNIAATHSNTETPAPRYRRVVKPQPQKQLSSYLSSGSFNTGSMPLSHERRVQRFKAIFLAICAATFAYILYCAVFR